MALDYLEQPLGSVVELKNEETIFDEAFLFFERSAAADPVPVENESFLAKVRNHPSPANTRI